jgi:hypothetical protein
MSTDGSGSHGKYHANGALEVLLETAKRWGIFAAIVCILIGFVLWLTKHLLERDQEREQYIRGELSTIVKDGTKAQVEFADAVEEFKEGTTELTNAIEEFSEAQKPENPE